MPIEPNYDLLKEVDDLLERAEEIRDECVALALTDPAMQCSNCGSRKWVGEYCANCGKHWRGR